jgi:ribonucleoside-diphosphate reductase alpha chain
MRMVEIDYSRDALLDDYAIDIIKERYLLPNETSPQEGFARAAQTYCDGDYDLAQRIYDYVSNLWFMFASPVLANAGTERGLPISCFLNYVPDSLEGISSHWDENIWLASRGGGIGAYWGDLRTQGTQTSKGSKSNGVMPFISVIDREILAISQGGTRRGSYAAYMDIDSPEIEEFIDMRKPTGGDPNRRNFNLHHGINISDDFMHLLESCISNPAQSDGWSLRDPHTKRVVKTISAKGLWQRILLARIEVGEPYLHFIDTTRRLQPECHRDTGLEVKQSNLCSEIVLPTNAERTAVCCLSSVNLEYYDKWKNTNMVRDITRFLDNVLTYFIERAPQDKMSKAIYSASQERSIGIGAMGFHSYLQEKKVPFESAMAVGINRNMFKHLKDEAYKETKQLAKERGPAPDSVGYDEVRNVHLLAIAPNASSSILCGNTSPSVEPLNTNIYNQKTLNGTNTKKNAKLDRYLKEWYSDDIKAYNKCWKSILANTGSVQHLDWMTDDIKAVFKTAPELNQKWIIEHAAHRQEFICQSQSINVFFPADVHKRVLHETHFDAWKKGLKTLYYLRSMSLGRTENIDTKLGRDILVDESECLSCEG